MKKIKGKYTKANVYVKDLDKKVEQQIQDMCDSATMKNCKIAIMPDAHYGKGVPIGTTIQLKEYVNPDFVGVDIGCGVSAQRIKAHDGFDFEKLQNIIEEKIPSGRSAREIASPFAEIFKKVFKGLYSKREINLDRAARSIGTLGGGNHFISIEQSKNQPSDEAYLLVHSGSRNFGYQIATFFSKLAKQETEVHNATKRQEIISACKKEGRESEIQSEIIFFNENLIEKTPALSDINRTQYINDMLIAVNYAQLNREVIIEEICNAAKYEQFERLDTIHNYIDTDFVLRKGAVSAHARERFILPINMMEGSLLCTGKGNKKWNYSAPHGAGRLMSRTEAKKTLSMDNFSKEMSSIWTKSVSLDTLDEAPGAYKSVDEITEYLQQTATIQNKLIPLYNFKASS